MKEIIQAIGEVTFKDGWHNYDGYSVTTNKQTIKLGIDNGQCCCENWGYFWTNDNVEEFIGAEVLDVKIVDECLDVHQAPEIYEGGVMFVTIVTDRGDLQFTAYNEHNGYYGHAAIVVSEQLTEEIVL